MCLSGDYWKIIDVYLVIIRNCRKEGRKEEEKGHIYNRPKGLASSIEREVGAVGGFLCFPRNLLLIVIVGY